MACGFAVTKGLLSMKGLFDKITVVIPSYRPDEKLLQVVEALVEKGFRDIILVDDGSGERYEPLFKKAFGFPGVTVLKHKENRGKGCALKTAFSYCIKERPECSGVITVDGDNQHHVEDIVRCCEKLSENVDRVILGVRDFTAGEAPFRSRFGNRITKAVFRLACGIKITDTQTGLRAVPAKYLPMLSEIEGSRYEYETNMLLEWKACGIAFEEVAVRTIYLDGNNSSHFHPFRDSLLIYRTIFAFVFSSLAAGLLDLFLFYLCISLFGRMASGGVFHIVAAAAVARAGSSLLNYHLNRHRVFRTGGRNSIVKYYALCLLQFAVSTGLVTVFAAVFPLGNLGRTFVKAVVDMLLFLISYQIQREWVFRKGNGRISQVYCEPAGP